MTARGQVNKPIRYLCWMKNIGEVKKKNRVGLWEGFMSKKLAVAMFGQKRLSREGGVEIVVKELCTRMAQNGCDVTCYNRAGHHVSGAEYDDATIEYEDVHQKTVPTINRRGARDIIGSTKKTYDN